MTLLSYSLGNKIILTQVEIFLRQGRLVMEAEKAAHTLHRLFVFLFFINIFILKVFSCGDQSWSRGPKARGQRQGHKKKPEAKAKDSLSEDRTSRGLGHKKNSRPRPRTKDTGASVLQKKKKNVFKNFF